MLAVEVRVAVLVATLGCVAIAAAQPANDDCANATVIGSLPFSDLGVDMTTATTEAGDPAPTGLCGGVGTNSIWYRLPAGAPETLLRGLAEGTGTKYGIRIVTGGCGAPVVKERYCPDPSVPLPEFGVYAEGVEVLIEIVNLDVAGTLDLTIDEIPEFLVDVDGGNLQTVAGGPSGFLAVWMDSVGLGAQLLDPQGSRIGSAFALPGDFRLDAAAAGDGSFFVVSEGTEGARVDGPGSVVVLPPRASGENPVVAADADGDFVVAWEAPDGSSSGIFAQRFDRDGVAQGAAFQVNTYTTSSQRWPAVAMAATGEFVVIWSGADHVFDDGLGARLYDAGGIPVTGEFLVNVDSDGGTCGPKSCWKPLGNPPATKGYRYKDKERTPNGILKMVLKPGVEGRSKVVIKGGQGDVFTGGPGAPPLPLPLPVTVQLQNVSGECWQATYDTAGVGVNETGFFKGSGS